MFSLSLFLIYALCLRFVVSLPSLSTFPSLSVLLPFTCSCFLVRLPLLKVDPSKQWFTEMDLSLWICRRSEAEKGAFKIASVLYSLCYLLAPELQNDFPITLLRNFVPDFKPVEINWARFVLWTLGVVLQSMRVHKSEMETRRLEFLDALYYFRFSILTT